MEFIIKQQELTKGLNIIASSVSSRVNLAILNNILIEALDGKIRITATDLETATTCRIGASVKKEGSSTVPARSFIDFFNALPQGDVNVSSDGQLVRVLGEKNSASFNCQPSSDFPVIPQSESKADVSFEFKDFIGKIGRVIFACAIDGSRPILTGVLFSFTKDKLEFVATDGYRLSYESLKGDFSKVSNQRVVIPASTLATILKLTPEKDDENNKQRVDFWLLSDGKQVVFEIGGTRIVSKIIEGEYPAWEKIVPADFSTKVTIQKDEFLKAVKLSAVFARDSGNIVKIVVKNQKTGEMVLSANTREIGENQSLVDVLVDGPGGEIAFNFRYLSDILNVLSAEQLTFSMIESLNPGKFTDGSGEFFHIIMPVRVQS